MTLRAGDRVEVVNARGERTERVALTEVIQGRDFPVVHVVSVAEYAEATATGQEPNGVVWPAEDVHQLVVR